MPIIPKCITPNCDKLQFSTGPMCYEHGCHYCGGIILADTEDLEHPLCAECVAYNRSLDSRIADWKWVCNQHNSPDTDCPFCVGIALSRELEAARSELASARQLLNPTCSEETLEGAIRNLQQAYITERDNAATLEASLEQAQAATQAVTQAIPQTYGEFFLTYGFYPPCEPHEWDNRTTLENMAWIVNELEEDKNFFEGTGTAAFDVLADALGLKSGGLLSTAIEAAKEINRLRAALPVLADAVKSGLIQLVVKYPDKVPGGNNIAETAEGIAESLRGFDIDAVIADVLAQLEANDAKGTNETGN